MLSEHRDKEAFLWMGRCLESSLGSTDKVCRALMSDGDVGLDVLQIIPIFAQPYCKSVTCKVHKLKNMLERCPEKLKNYVENLVFGSTNARGIHINGFVDLFSREQYAREIENMLRDPAFSENEELKSWFKHHQHVLFERCSLRSRLKAGYGFDTASTNTNECHNKLFKEDINNKKLPLHELIPKIEDYCFKTLEYGFDAILHGREYKLSKAKRELKTSPKEWESLTLEQKSAIMKKLGYGDWFDHPRTRPSNIPLFLLEHLENVQRKNLETRAIELSKFCLFDDSGEVKAVVDKDSRRTVQRFALLVNLNTIPLFCGCCYIDKDQLICEHLVAACYATDDFKPLTVEANHFKMETVQAAQKREYHLNMGTKKNERRRGSLITRQHPLHPTEMHPTKRCLSELDLSPTSTFPTENKKSQPEVIEIDNNNEITLLSSTDSHLPNIRSLSQRANRKKKESILPCSSQPITPLSSRSTDVPDEAVHRKYIRQHKPYPIPCYWNDNHFVLSKLKEQRNAQKCCSCKFVFDKHSTDLIKSHVISHQERFVFPKNGESFTSTAEHKSYICAKIECLLSRYPYFEKPLLQYSASISEHERAIFNRDFNV